MSVAAERRELERALDRAAERERKAIARRHVWLLIAKGQLNAAEQAANRDQWARVDHHRNQALKILEKIGLENLEVIGFTLDD